jgi:hypothetical protein
MVGGADDDDDDDTRNWFFPVFHKPSSQILLKVDVGDFH